MFVKALWAKEYTQARALLWGLFAVSFFYLPFSAMRQLANVQALIDSSAAPPQMESFYFTLNHGFSFALFILIIVLGCQLIGGERSYGQDDFTLSLPYSRSVIYLTKWGIGSLAILVSVTVNLFLAYLLLRTSPLTPYLSFDPHWGFYWLQLVSSSLALYTLTLFMGIISGGYRFQFAFSFIFAIFPLGFAVLLNQFLMVHGFHQAGFMTMLGRNSGSFIFNLTLFTHLMIADVESEPDWTWLFPFLYLVVFLPWGAYLYNRNKVEYNGRLLVFPGLHRFFLWGIVICFALLGGFIVSGMQMPQSPGDRLFYYLGMLILGSIAYWLTLRLLHKPIQGKRRIGPVVKNGSNIRP